jgi:hypothetical protein
MHMTPSDKRSDRAGRNNDALRLDVIVTSSDRTHFPVRLGEPAEAVISRAII